MLNKLLKPGIMLAVGIGGFIVTNILTARGTVNFQREKEAKQEELGRDLETKEAIPIAIKNYAAAFVAGILSGGVIFAGNKVYSASHATLLTAYGLLNTRYSKYRDYVFKQLGIDDVKSIEDDIKKTLERKPILTTVKKFPDGHAKVTDTYHHGDIVVRLHVGKAEVYVDTTMEELEMAKYETQHLVQKLKKISFNQFAEFFGQNLGEEGDNWGVNQEFLYNTSEDDDCWIDFQEEYNVTDNYYDVTFTSILGWEV